VNTRRFWFTPALLLLAPALTALADNDPYGDPLPVGAKARMGTDRMRVITYSSPLLSPDGKTLYAQTNSGLLKLDPATGTSQGKVQGIFSGAPAGLSADGKRAAQLNFGGVTVWNLETGKSLVKIERRLPGVDVAAALSADGKTLALGGVGEAAKKEPVTVLVWDVDGDKEIKKITVPQNQSASAVISTDGKTLATWGSHYEPDAKGPPDPETNLNRIVTFWNVADGKELAKFRVAGYAPATVAFSPDGALVAVANNTGSIDLVDPKTGTSKHTLLGRTRMGRWIVFSPDGSTVGATGDDGAVQRWKVADGTRLTTTDAPATNLYGARVRLLSNEKGIAWGMKNSAVLVWEVPSGKLLSPEGGHVTAVRGVAVTPDNKFVVTSADDGTALKWELTTGKPAGTVTIRQPNPGFGGYLPAAQFAPNFTTALVRDSSGSFGIHDVTTGSQQYVIPAPTDSYSNGTFSADGSKVVVATSSYEPKKKPGHVSVWDVAKAKRVFTLDLPNCGSVVASITPDGKYVVTAARKTPEKGNDEFLVTAWDTATGAKKGEHSEEAGFTTAQVVTGADNKTAAVVTARGRLVVFDIATGKLTKTFDLNRRVPGAAPVFSSDGKKLAVASQSDFDEFQTATVWVFDWESGDTKHTLSVKGGTPTAMTFSPDGKWLVTGSNDTTATVWDVSK
jgi:WD40 repeat protein